MRIALPVGQLVFRSLLADLI